MARLMRYMVLALLLTLALAAPAQAVKPIVNAPAVQALAWHYIASIDHYQMDEAWLGKCVRHGRNYVECRIWVVWSHRLEMNGGRSVYRCHDWLSVEGFPEDMGVRVSYPSWDLSTCEHWIEGVK